MLRDGQAGRGVRRRRERLEAAVERAGDPLRVRLRELGALAREQLVDGREPEMSQLLEVPARGGRPACGAARGAGTRRRRRTARRAGSSPRTT